jgi:methylthioribose-1-phosphate isomerase
MMETAWSLGLAALHGATGTAIALWWSSYHYGTKLKQERAWTDEALADTERIAQELESTRKLNVELARDKEQLDEQVRNQMFTIEAFQKRETLFDEAKNNLAATVKLNHELANENCRLRKENREMSDECSHLRKQAIDSERCLDVFRDLSIHLNDMAYEIASVAPNAKGD